MKYFLPLLLICLFNLSGFAQCKFDINTAIDVDADFFVQGNVFGLINDDMSTQTQGICGVNIEFEHEYIGNLQIELISPFGQSIILIGPPQIGSFTNGTNWNISMNPCSNGVVPDPGFPSTWSNGAPWTIGGAFTGSYYPYSGCLEDFNIGNPNGNWQLHILNGAFYTGEIKSFTLIFCDPLGISCLPCAPQAGNLNINQISFCKNDVGLSTFIPSINFPNGSADSQYYNYKYVIILNGTIIGLTDLPDWTLLSEGNYEIYGISYLKSYESIILSYIGDNYSNLQSLIASTSICGDLTPDSLILTINRYYDLPLKEIVICKNDTLIIGTKQYFTSQIIRDTFATEKGCDSIVNINLVVANISTTILTDTIDCMNKVVHLDTLNFASNVSNFQILGFSWKDPIGNIISTNGSVDVSIAGEYSLEVIALFGSLVCNYLFEAPVIKQVTTPEIPEILPVNPCSNLQTIFVLKSDTLRNDAQWTFEGNPDVLISNDSAFVTWAIAGSYKVCVYGTNQCGSSDTLCQTFVVNPTPDFTFKYDTLTCDGNFEIKVINPSVSLTWSADVSILNFSVNSNGAEVNGSLLPGIEEGILKYAGSIGNCDINGALNIRRIEVPLLSGIRDTAVCGPSLLTFNIVHDGVGGNLYYTWEGTQRILFVNSNNVNLSFQVNASGQLVIDSLITPYATCNLIQPLTYNIIVNDPPLSVFSDTITLCNTFNENGFPKYFLDDFILSGDKGGKWNISTLPGVIIINDSIDISLLAAGNYTVNYTTNSALVPCKEVNYKIILKVVDCTCPIPANISTALKDIEICSNYGIIDLDSLYMPSDLVSWFTIDNTGLQTQLPSHYYNISSNQHQQSFILKTISNWYGQCPDSILLNLDIDQAKYAGDDLSLTYCISDKTNIVLDTILDNVKDVGKWYAFPQSFPGILQAFNPGKRELDISKLGSGELTLYSVVKSNNICLSDTARLDIFINQKPKIEISGTAFLDCATLETLLYVNGSNINDYLVSWSYDNLIFHTSSNIDSQWVNQAGLYNFYVINTMTGCKDTTAYNIQNAADSIKEVDYDVLSNCENKKANLFVNDIFGGSPPFKYSLDSGPFVAYTQFYDLDLGPHMISIMDSKNCLYDLDITVNNTSGFELDLGPDLYIEIGDSVQYQIDFPGDLVDSIEISLDGVMKSKKGTSGYLSPSATQVLSVSILDIFGCLHTDELTIFVDNTKDVFIPNIFSPNGDGINDKFYIPLNSSVKKVMEFKIYDRWGNNVYGYKDFEPGEESTGWDGMFHGKIMDPSVFVYYVRYISVDGNINFKKGSFTLIR